MGKATKFGNSVKYYLIRKKGKGEARPGDEEEILGEEITSWETHCSNYASP